jgi:hypothetical protein
MEEEKYGVCPQLLLPTVAALCMYVRRTKQYNTCSPNASGHHFFDRNDTETVVRSYGRTEIQSLS